MDMETEIIQETEMPIESEKNVEIEYNCESDLKNLTKKVKRLEILSCVIIFLIAASMAVPMIMPSVKDRATTNDELKTLPASIDKTELINNLQEAYNNQNIEQLYNIFGEYTKERVPIEGLKKTLPKLFPALGKLTEVRFDHYTYEGSHDGADWFKLTYVGKYEAGNGNVFVTIKVVDDKWEVTTYFFNINYMNQ